jgi:hypothetical protein
MEKKSIEKNMLDMVFGPTGSFAGIIIFIAGLVMIYYSMTALIMAGFGAFVAFSFSGAMIDYDRRRVKFQLMLFGLIPLGKWIQLSGEENLKVELYSRSYRTYSRANIPLDIKRADYRVFILHPSGKFRFPLRKFKTRQEAVEAAQDIANRLGAKII